MGWGDRASGKELRPGIQEASWRESTVPGRFRAGEGGQCTAKDTGKDAEAGVGGVTCEDGPPARDICPVPSAEKASGTR